jgi:hypothetical protein
VNVTLALMDQTPGSIPCSSQGEARAMALLLLDLTERPPPAGLPEATAVEMRRLLRERLSLRAAFRPSAAPPPPQLSPAPQRAEEEARRQRGTAPPAPPQPGVVRGATALGAAAGSAAMGEKAIVRACAACGKARGAVGVKLRPSLGCYPVLTTFYCSVSGG